MSYIAFPLRLEGSARQPEPDGLVRHGGLLRCQRVEAIDQLLEIMANTPAGSWAGDNCFGFPFFMGLSLSKQTFSQAALRTLNAALEELGITDFRLDSVVREPAQKFGEIRYSIGLCSTLDGEIHRVEVPRQETNAHQSTNSKSDRQEVAG